LNLLVKIPELKVASKTIRAGASCWIKWINPT